VRAVEKDLGHGGLLLKFHGINKPVIGRKKFRFCP
jgi:hypothetical protein